MIAPIPPSPSGIPSMTPRPFLRFLVCVPLWIACTFAWGAVQSRSQEGTIILGGSGIKFNEGLIINQTPANPQSPSPTPPSSPPTQPPQSPPAATSEGERKEKPKEASKEEKGKSEEAETIKRTSQPPQPPIQREFEVRPDEQGMVQFQFRNQPWPDLLRWLAEVSHMALDWQELPGDYINLATQRKYTLEEARDLFNRHLLARGYTMLEFDGVIQVVKTKGINIALVPKVEARELDRLPPNRFVRTTFHLTSLMADEAAEEFGSLISTNGRLTPLSNTNRLEAMDSVQNLREIQRILQDEQSDESKAQLAKEIPLVHVRAVDAKQQVEIFLGIDKPASAMPMDPRAMQAMQQQMAQQQQLEAQARQNGSKSPTTKKPAKVEIYLVANERLNSIIAHAPPNKMAIIESFLKRFDVPSNMDENFAMMQSRMRVYRLTTLSPEKLVKSLQSMNALEPMTRLEVDKDNNAIIAYASLADQYTIQKLIERLDGSARRFDVLQLKRLKAEEVAGTIKFMMGADDKRNDSRRWYDWGYGGNEKKSTDVFRVGANIQDNQILLWANDSERQEINNLLIKLGEVPAEGGGKDPFRVIDASRSPATFEYLKRLRERWEQMSPNQLILPPEEAFQSEEDLIQKREKAPAPLPVPKASPDSKADPEGAKPITLQQALEKHTLLASIHQPMNNDEGSMEQEPASPKGAPRIMKRHLLRKRTCRLHRGTKNHRTILPDE